MSDKIPDWSSDDGRKRVLILSSTPRVEGNSQRLAEATRDGALEAGHEVHLVRLVDHQREMLRDCRKCRTADGQCSIEDGHRRIFLDLFLTADTVVYATPIWWYGISAQLKAFLDRTFCYVAASYPDAERVAAAIPGKRAALLLSAEESNFAARLGITTQMSEMCRYLHHDFVGIVVGIGNSRSEVGDDPGDPLESARALGARLFDIRQTDYQLDTARSPRVWDGNNDPFPAQWR
ncbi:MAG: flavodoxin family protein [Alphaproteobacteria bacterium]|nr:flavodoxin family protein [Alphaproteobacteria bacterium]